MLVLSRKKNESIVIDGKITIEVLQVKGKGVRIGIKAPSDVHVLRGELQRHKDEFAAEPESDAESTFLPIGEDYIVELPIQATA